jgi:hypothetical protein
MILTQVNTSSICKRLSSETELSNRDILARLELVRVIRGAFFFLVSLTFFFFLSFLNVYNFEYDNLKFTINSFFRIFLKKV